LKVTKGRITKRRKLPNIEKGRKLQKAEKGRKLQKAEKGRKIRYSIGKISSLRIKKEEKNSCGLFSSSKQCSKKNVENYKKLGKQLKHDLDIR
jgi:hypothetical protein